ncbi:MAG TPA: carbohydrate-binding family 9-like protein [Candidatus Sulfotelmatobacter sp.]|nr:carbohydrate-binding family 9-like protein [Candidatus Sulfotelmatobacter sp.]
MNSLLRMVALTVTCASLAFAGDKTIQSMFAESDPSLDTNPASSFWRGSPPTYMDADKYGKPDPRYRTEIRTRWTRQNLYLLFICPYEELSLKPQPTTSAETYGLWDWDVAEAFIGADFKAIRRYKEFEISPRGEWIDLDIDLDKPQHEDGWKWNSGFAVSARIDPAAHVWYGAMRIPYSAIDTRPAASGNLLRIDLFRSQGPASARHQLAWQAPMAESFHVPERFGLLKLVERQH